MLVHADKADSVMRWCCLTLYNPSSYHNLHPCCRFKCWCMLKRQTQDEMVLLDPSFYRNFNLHPCCRFRCWCMLTRRTRCWSSRS